MSILVGKKKLKLEFTVPNILTALRLAAVPLLAWLIWQWPTYQTAGFITFLLIWLTDLLDGWIARTFDCVTEFGKLFDPVVDKIFQVTTAVMMFLIGRIPIWVPIFMIIRETVMIVGGWYLLHKRDTVVYSDIYGKAATFFYVLAFGALFWVPDDPRWFRDLIFIIPASLSVAATINYAHKNRYGFSFVRSKTKEENEARE